MQDKIKTIVTEFLESKGLEVPADLFRARDGMITVNDNYLEGVELVLVHPHTTFFVTSLSETYSALSLDGAHAYGHGYDLYDEFCKVMDANGLTCSQIYDWCSGISVHRDFNKESMEEVQALLEQLADPDSALYDDLGEICGQAADALKSFKNN